MGGPSQKVVGGPRHSRLALLAIVALLVSSLTGCFVGLGGVSTTLRLGGDARPRALGAGRAELADGARRQLITARFEGEEIVHRAPQGTIIGRTRPNAERTRFEHRDTQGRDLGYDEVVDGRRVLHFGPRGEFLGESVRGRGWGRRPPVPLRAGRCCVFGGTRR